MTSTSLTPQRPVLAVAVLKAMRPKQWAKNVLVFIAPAAASAFVSRGVGGISIHWHALQQGLFAFVVFCMVASATYLINDTMDVDSDRRHPTKRNRPIAAGWVSIPLAITLAVILLSSGLALALWRNWHFCLVVALYVIQTTAYSMWLKHEPVLDVVALSGGFILRLLGGAYAVDVDVSVWFFIISCFGSLFIAVGKRMAEQRELEDDFAGIRKTLTVYTQQYLRFLQAVSAAIVLVGYVQWAFERSKLHEAAAVWTMMSILPFLVAILRYALLVELGEGSAPEDLLSSDRQLQVVGLIWAILVGVGFYVAS